MRRKFGEIRARRYWHGGRISPKLPGTLRTRRAGSAILRIGWMPGGHTQDGNGALARRRRDGTTTSAWPDRSGRTGLPAARADMRRPCRGAAVRTGALPAVAARLI